MAIHPIEYRYGTPEMRQVFTEEAKLGRILEVEAALAMAQAEVGEIPREAAETIAKHANTENVSLDRVKEVEREIRHDVMAVAKVLAEVCGPEAGKYVHLGVTSSDITDTALALQLREATDIIKNKLEKLMSVLAELARKHRKTVCVGRTHGQHAVPTTYGLKFAIWLDEVRRHIQRLEQCRERLLVGQITGAVGTQAALGPHAMKIQEIVMQKLGLRRVNVSNQVVQRDRHAEYILLLALISATLDKIATEIRNLQRTEIDEVRESFDVSKQVGSSTMPHKRNPELCERVSGLSRVVRAYTIPALENVPLWHERDLSNSSCERVIIPEATILLDYILSLTTQTLENLEVIPRRITRNLGLTKGRIMAEAVMIRLVKRGVGRQEAHELMRRCSIEAEREEKHLKDVLLSNEAVLKHLSPVEIEELMDPSSYVGTAEEQVDKLLEEVCTKDKQG